MPPDASQPWSWITRAEQDRSAARRLFTPGCLECSVIACLCQQAVEKMLKAFLVQSGVEPERTHDLRRLIATCATFDERFGKLADTVEPLNQYAIGARYPGPPEPTSSEITAAIAAMDQVWPLVISLVPEPPAEDQK